MIATILKGNHPSRPAFASCMEQYLQQLGQCITFQNDNFPPHLNEMLRLAINEQTLIGWHQLLLGYILSKKLLLFAAMDTPNIGKMTLSAGQSRTCKALKAVTLMVWELWLGSNNVLHKYKDAADQQIYFVESAEIRHFHSTPTLIPTLDQQEHNCWNITLNKLLQSFPSVHRQWLLHRVKTARAAYLKDGQNQQTVTQYMERIPLMTQSTERLANPSQKHTAHAKTPHSNGHQHPSSRYT